MKGQTLLNLSKALDSLKVLFFDKDYKNVLEMKEWNEELTSLVSETTKEERETPYSNIKFYVGG